MITVDNRRSCATNNEAPFFHAVYMHNARPNLMTFYFHVPINNIGENADRAVLQGEGNISLFLCVLWRSRYYTVTDQLISFHVDLPPLHRCRSNFQTQALCNASDGSFFFVLFFVYSRLINLFTSGKLKGPHFNSTYLYFVSTFYL